jgi:hypothetical protein
VKCAPGALPTLTTTVAVAVELRPLLSVTVNAIVFVPVAKENVHKDELEQVGVPLLIQLYVAIGALPGLLVLSPLTVTLPP